MVLPIRALDDAAIRQLTLGNAGDGPSTWEIALYVGACLVVLALLGLNAWRGYMAWPAAFVLLGVHGLCLALAWLVWKGRI